MHIALILQNVNSNCLTFDQVLWSCAVWVLLLLFSCVNVVSQRVAQSQLVSKEKHISTLVYKIMFINNYETQYHNMAG